MPRLLQDHGEMMKVLRAEMGAKAFYLRGPGLSGGQGKSNKSSGFTRVRPLPPLDRLYFVCYGVADAITNAQSILELRLPEIMKGEGIFAAPPPPEELPLPPPAEPPPPAPLAPPAPPPVPPAPPAPPTDRLTRAHPSHPHPLLTRVHPLQHLAVPQQSEVVVPGQVVDEDEEALDEDVESPPGDVGESSEDGQLVEEDEWGLEEEIASPPADPRDDGGGWSEGDDSPPGDDV